MIRLFDIENLREAVFLSRPNRFIAEILIDGKVELAHVHDPGRLRELLVKDAPLLVISSKAKLPWYVKAVKAIYEDNEWVLLDSALQPKIARSVFPLLDEFSHVRSIKSEVTISPKSRIDFMMDGVPLEVKGASLMKDGVSLFPDAPTERGARHVHEIIERNGMIMMIIYRNVTAFSPHFDMDPKFSQAMQEARRKGIKIICISVYFDGKTIFYRGMVPLGKW